MERRHVFGIMIPAGKRESKGKNNEKCAGIHTEKEDAAVPRQRDSSFLFADACKKSMHPLCYPVKGEDKSMEYRKQLDTYIVRLDRGEEVMECLTQLCEKEQIRLAQVTAIGAADEAEVGLYNVEMRQYHKTKLEGEMEILSILGNVTRKEGEVYLHLHISLGLKDTAVRGGHLNSCRISGTCEMFVRELTGEVGRKPDDRTGLNVFDFGEET